MLDANRRFHSHFRPTTTGNTQAAAIALPTALAPMPSRKPMHANMLILKMLPKLGI
jgi:hypothetical protein